jgi:hypothetical protein
MPKEAETKDVALREHDKTLLQWKAPEFVTYQKGKRWFLVAGVLILGLIAYAIYSSSATMAIVFIVLAGVYFMTHRLEPKTIDVHITELGIDIDGNFYPYTMIEYFWIVYHPKYYRDLNLKIKNQASKITIQLHEQSPAEVRRVLSKEIEEVKGVHESLMDVFIRLLRL